MPRVVVGADGQIRQPKAKKEKKRKNDKFADAEPEVQPEAPPKKVQKAEEAADLDEEWDAEGDAPQRKRPPAREDAGGAPQRKQSDAAAQDGGQVKEAAARKPPTQAPKAGSGMLTRTTATAEVLQSDFRVFVSCIPWNLDEEALRTDFEECGEVLNCKLLVNKESGESRGQAFITFKDEAGFKAALSYDGEEYGGSRLRVKKADPKGSSSRGSAAQAKPPGCNSIVLRKLSSEVTKDDLYQFFAKAGAKPLKVGLLTDKATGKSRCTARIDYAPDSELLDKAMALTGASLKGGVLAMAFCQPRREDEENWW